MFSCNWWNMFENYGTIELYLLYKMMEKQERENAGDENIGADTDLGKFE